MTTALKTVQAIEKKRYAMRYAQTTNEFLLQTTSPAAASSGSAVATSVFNVAEAELLCSDECKAALAQATAEKPTDFWSDALLRVLSKEQTRQASIDPALIAKKSTLATEAFCAWVSAKKSSDWSIFAPYLTKALEIAKEIAASIAPTKDAYDVSLDLFEEGTSRAFYDELFATIDTHVLPLLSQVKEAPEPPNSLEGMRFSAEKQRKLADLLLDVEGINKDALTFAYSEHPFTIATDPGNVFVTTHIYEDKLLANLYTVLHEGGHALYQQGISEKTLYTSLDDTPGFGIDESQSRFFENYVGRSWPFMAPLLEILLSLWPDELSGLTQEELYAAVNCVQKNNCIRTEADELTYPFHVQVRYEIERELFSGDLHVDDVPRRWNELMQKYLGVTVKDDAHGCLQDIHWSACEFGYFPTYVLGSLIGAELLKPLSQEVSFNELLANGDLAPIKNWLQEHIWQWGRAKTTQEIMAEVCGKSISAEPFCAYLTEKYTALYSL